MSRKKTTLIIILFLIIIAGIAGVYFYMKGNTNPNNTDTTGGFGSLVPGGDPNTPDEEDSTATSTDDDVLPRLRQITKTPVAGYDFVDQGSGFKIWYVDRGNGNIFETATNTLAVTRITNTTIPKVYEAYIGKGGANIILRLLDEETEEIQTFIGSPKSKAGASSTSEVKELTGTFTTPGISFVSLSPLKDKFFGLTSITGGLGYVYPYSGTATNVFSHAFKQWIPQWVNSSTILLTGAPSSRTQNLAYFLNPTTKAFTKVLGPKNGLVVSSSPDAAYLLYSHNVENFFNFGVYETKTAVERASSRGTIPDKCTWSKNLPSVAFCGFPQNIPSASYPDAWYQGKVLFDDEIGTLDAKNGIYNSIIDLEKESGAQMDATNLMLSKDEKYLLFTNKRDLTLWMLTI